MAKWLAVAPALLLGSAGGYFVGYSVGADTAATNVVAEDAAQEDAKASAPSFALSAAASKAWFAPVSEYATDDQPLDEAKFNALLDTLKERLAAEETQADFEREAELYLWNFLRRLAAPALSEEQIAATDALLVELAERHPDHRALFEQRRRLLEQYAESTRTPPFSIVGGWFPVPKTLDTGGDVFADETIEQLIEILDALLAMPETLADFPAEVGTHLWRFANRLQVGRLNESQTARIVAFLEEVKTRHPEAAETVDASIFQVRNLMPGQVAPNIVGKDSEGTEFALEEYRGNIVALYFTGQWCGPCRGEYPYQRFMLDLYEDDPVTILGVNSDEDVQTLIDAKETEGLTYRTWWDGHGEKNTEGPIASSWNVTGWPTIYVLDEEGVIRTVNKRRAEVVTAINSLLDERRMREYEAVESQEAEVAQTEAGYVGSADFEEKVLQSDLPVLLDFTATWCVPCREVDPIVEELMVEMAGRANIYKLDIDETPDIYKQLAVNGVPTVIFFNNGKEEERIKSPQSKEVYVQYLEAMIEGRSAMDLSIKLLAEDSFRRHFILSRKPEDVDAASATYPGLLSQPFENSQTPLALILNAPSVYQDAKVELALSQGASIAPRDLVGLGRCDEFAAALAKDPQLVNEKDPDGNSVLTMAMSRSHRLENRGCLPLVLKSGVEVRDTNQERPLGRSAVLLEDVALLEQLLALGLDAEFTDTEGRNALHWAAYYTQPENVRVLLKHGVDPAIQTVKGETAADIVRGIRDRRVASLEERGESTPEVAERMQEMLEETKQVLALLDA